MKDINTETNVGMKLSTNDWSFMGLMKAGIGDFALGHSFL
jgi:hypothetical protein